VGWDSLTASDEVEAADWIRDRLHPFAQDVGSIVPDGFDAYARIFHPAWKSVDGQMIEVPWSEVAAWSGRTVHAEMQFNPIATPTTAHPTDPEPWKQDPRPGVLSHGQVNALVGLLARNTSTPDACFFCLWDGYGYLFGSVAVMTFWMEGEPKPNAPPRAVTRPRRPKLRQSRVRLPSRDYLLFTGSVQQGEGWEDGPNLWWPSDRSWCVASEIDFPYTYVGGSRSLIEEVVAHPLLEALTATASDGITADSDKINS
jgi:hypothetical protein